VLSFPEVWTVGGCHDESVMQATTWLKDCMFRNRNFRYSILRVHGLYV
jgi:hypothetical protein